MPLILDTFNVLHTVGVLPPDLAGIDVPGLAALILRSRYRGDKVIFACDGLPATDLPEPGRLASDSADVEMTVRYSGRGRTADDLIRDLINASSAPRRLTVVSSDHEVQRDARRRRCATLTSPEFLQQLADDANLPRTGQRARAIPPAMSAEQVDRWLDVFAVDEESLRVEAAGKDAPDAIVNQTGPEHSAGPGQPVGDGMPPEEHAAGPAGALPADLIADAEALYQREQASTPPRSPAASAPEPETSASDDHPDLANLDMNKILPADGRTQPLQRRGNRRRNK